jgi:LacI family transcriptional regulator
LPKRFGIIIYDPGKKFNHNPILLYQSRSVYNQLTKTFWRILMSVTIRDLAKKLNLSITQVSRALGGYKDVSETTREKVIEAAREMGYEPSYAARQLRRQRTDAIGYILPTSSPQFSDPFYANFLAGLCDEAAKHHLDVVVTSCPPGSDQEEALYQHWLQSARVDGMVLNRIRAKDWRVEYLAENRMPFVTLGLPETSRNFPSLRVNERGGFERLVQHLKDQGHRRIAFIGGPAELVVAAERSGGYLQGLKSAGLEYDEQLITQTDLTEEGGTLSACQLLALPNPPTAILGCNDQIAIGALRAAKEAGYKVGKEFAIAGYDGIHEAAYTDPPLTTLSQPTYEIARRLVNMLVAVINHQPLEQSRFELEPELILRASTES